MYQTGNTKHLIAALNVPLFFHLYLLSNILFLCSSQLECHSEDIPFSESLKILVSLSVISLITEYYSTFSGVSRETIELEFADYQSLEFIDQKDRVDQTWVVLGKIKDEAGEPRFRNLTQVMLGILTIPHANASCERVFSIVRKNHTAQRSELGPDTLDALLVVKSIPGAAHERKYTDAKLSKLKSAYYKSLQ